MTHLILSTLPRVVIRAIDAFRATDAIAIGEAFDKNAYLLAHVDSKLLTLMGVADPRKPLRAHGNLKIAQAIERAFSVLTITHTVVYDELRVGSELSAIIDFEAKLAATGKSVAACCSGIYTLSGDGRRIVKAHAICKLITPGWNYTFN